MDKKQELIKQCRYYKREIECPFDDFSELRQVWHSEKEWVELESLGNLESNPPFGYIEIFQTPPEELFKNSEYDTPISLLRVLYCFFCYYNACRSSQIKTKIVSHYDGTTWKELNITDAFNIFLATVYYKSMH